MKRALILIVLLLACSAAFAAEEAEPNLGICMTDDALEVKGKPTPPPACCDPALEPGVGGNPLCFEGHTCCADGRWNCNNPDGSPSCSPGTVCDGCTSTGNTCSSNEECCSGKCKGHRCR